MSKITVIGAHGKVAQKLIPILVERGDEVTGIIRNADQEGDIRELGATPLVLDVQSADEAALAAAFDGQDAVIWSAGAGGGDPERTYAVDRDAAIRSMDAATKAGADRYVMVSYMGAGPDHGVPEDNDFYPYAESKAAADEHLKASALKWTILGPGMLSDDDADGIEIVIEPREGEANTSRVNVARVAAEVIDMPAMFGRTIEFRDGDTTVEDALRS